MANYIDKKKVIEALKELLDEGAYDDDILFVIRNMPSVDAVEQKHGHWIVKRRGEYSDTQCSECGGYDRDIGIAKYCRNCGAKMDEVTE